MSPRRRASRTCGSEFIRPNRFRTAAAPNARNNVMTLTKTKQAQRGKMLIALLALLLLPALTNAQTTGPTPAAPAASPAALYVPVTVEGRRIFDVTSNGVLSATDRADMIDRRLQTLIAQPEDVPAFTQQDLKQEANETAITLGGQTLLSVTEGDAQAALMTRRLPAAQTGSKHPSTGARRSCGHRCSKRGRPRPERLPTGPAKERAAAGCGIERRLASDGGRTTEHFPRKAHQGIVGSLPCRVY